jgi:hypothetical protein
MNWHVRGSLLAGVKDFPAYRILAQRKNCLLFIIKLYATLELRQKTYTIKYPELHLTVSLVKWRKKLETLRGLGKISEDFSCLKILSKTFEWSTYKEILCSFIKFGVKN